MEYLEGASLEDMLADLPRLEFDRTLNILVQVCTGLQYAHGQGIVHQDIKPANIFVLPGDRAKIVDFGLACPTGSEDVIDFAGTPFYMAPEQIEGEPVDARTDIYSLGITAFEMATGQRPFQESDVHKLLEAHREKPTPDPRSIKPDLPPEFSHIVARATEKDPSGRYRNMDEVLQDLLPLAETMGVSMQMEAPQRRRMMSLFMFYGDDQQVELNRLVEDFSRQLRELGADLRVADFQDL
jgi:serine/threonine protein kinase